jgi:hypothetical protein
MEQSNKFQIALRAGFTARAKELVLLGYRNIHAERCYQSGWGEETFSVQLYKHIDHLCPVFSRTTHQQWDVKREYYKDTPETLSGEHHPREAPRIDIALFNWSRLGAPKRIFPFECKLLDDNAEHIRLYIKDGLIDRYLNPAKDYADGKSWGGMIGYIRLGHHADIVEKLNQQIDRQLSAQIEHLKLIREATSLETMLEAVYESQHARPVATNTLTITHLLLHFHHVEANRDIEAKAVP